MNGLVRIFLVGLTVASIGISGHSKADVVVDDGSCNFRPVADNSPSRGSIWASMAQSFTAPYSRVSFGFRLFDAVGVSPQAGKAVIYNLYEGEISPLNLLASRTVQFPATTLGFRCGRPDVGFVEVDFSGVELIVGQKYTIEVTVPSSDMPALESYTSISVWTSLVNPYPDGRFYFPLIPANPVSFNNGFFVDHDMLFRIFESGPAEQLAALQAKATGIGPGASLANKLALARTYYAVPNVQATCAVLSAFLNQVRAQSGKKLTPELAGQLTGEARAIMTAIGCN